MITPNKLREAAKNQDTQQMTLYLIEAANVLQLALLTLEASKQTIRAWHDMRSPREYPPGIRPMISDDDPQPAGAIDQGKTVEAMMWNIYERDSPEMKLINRFLRYRDPMKPADVQFAEQLLELLKGRPNHSQVWIDNENLDVHHDCIGDVGQLRSLAETIAIAGRQ